MLGLLSLFFTRWDDQQENPNRDYSSRVADNGVREINLLRNRYGHYLASGKINGHDVVFLLDTGATSVSIPAAVARRIGLQAGAPQTVSTANGSVTVTALASIAYSWAPSRSVTCRPTSTRT